MSFNEPNIVSSLELSNTKVWLTLGEIDGLKLEVHNPESSVLDRKTKGTVYFEKRNVARYSIHIQATDYSERVCELWVKSPSGRVTRKVLRRTLSPAMEGSRVKGGKVYYWIDSTNTGTKLVTGTKIGNSTAMGTITVKLIERHATNEFTFIFRHQVDGEADPDSDFLISDREDFDQFRDHSEPPAPPLKRRRILPSISRPLTLKRSESPHAHLGGTSRDRLGTGVRTGSTAPTEIDVYTFDAFEDRISQRGAATEEGINPRKIVEVVDRTAARERLCSLLEKCQADILKQFDECVSAARI